MKKRVYRPETYSIVKTVNEDVTQPSVTISNEAIEKAEREYNLHLEGLLELDRFIGTHETLGGYLNEKPNYSNPEQASINFKTRF